MNGYPETARLCEHARQRCAEMGISTKVVKRIVQHPVVTHRASPGPKGQPRTMVRSNHFPEYVAILDDQTGWVMTVMYWSPDKPFVRGDIARG